MRPRNSCFALLLPLATACVSAQIGNGKLQIHHLDMGQGDAAVLISPLGKVVLLDAGEDIAHVKKCSVETSYLKKLGVTQIDAIIVSHYHSDHIGCIPAVLAEFPLNGPSYDRGESYDSPSTFFPDYVKAVGSHRSAVTIGEPITLDDGPNPVMLKVESLNGTYPGGTVETENENDLSVSVLVSFGAFREEIGGDLSGEDTTSYQDIETGVVPSIGELDVYKVHHHCSAYSTNEAWLKVTEPTVAIISTGDHNTYHHPADACLNRLHDSEVQKVYWTEKGAGQPGVNDVLAGTVSIEVAPGASSYTVSYGSTTDTYKIKTPATPPGPTPPIDPGKPRYAYNLKGTVYYFVSCPAVKRIPTENLRYSVDPPTDKKPSACVLAGVGQ